MSQIWGSFSSANQFLQDSNQSSVLFLNNIPLGCRETEKSSWSSFIYCSTDLLVWQRCVIRTVHLQQKGLIIANVIFLFLWGNINNSVFVIILQNHLVLSQIYLISGGLCESLHLLLLPLLLQGGSFVCFSENSVLLMYEHIPDHFITVTPKQWSCFTAAYEPKKVQSSVCKTTSVLTSWQQRSPPKSNNNYGLTEPSKWDNNNSTCTHVMHLDTLWVMGFQRSNLVLKRFPCLIPIPYCSLEDSVSSLVMDNTRTFYECTFFN